ncbi:MAG: hypothetical protein OHK0048_15730 [Rhodoferax sp.]
MRTNIFRSVTAAATLACTSAFAGGHYVPGVEGVQAASVPPPGNYYLGYLVNYNINELKAPGSTDAIPGSNKGTVVALANRFAFITQQKFLGADYGFEFIVPIVRTSLTFDAAPPLTGTSSGVGDVYLGPLVLGWHGANWDAVAAAGIWLDNASHDKASAPGHGYKSTMLTGGGTVYLDDKKTTSFSALARYEYNGKIGNVRPGSQLSVEWGLGRVFGGVQAGIVGYSQVQLEADTGGSDKYRRHAVGAEVSLPLLDKGVVLKAAAYKEFSAKGGTDPMAAGSTVRFTLVKFF